MKKKFACLMMALLFCVSALAGCSLVTRVDAKYYNATVATLTYEDGTTETISKRDLLVAYNSYGYNYVDSYGYELEEAISLTLDSLIETRVIIKAVEDYCDSNGEELLNDAEKTYLWEETYDAVLENLREYYNDVSGNSDSDDSDDSTSSDNIFVDYEREAVLKKTKNVDEGGNVTYSYSISRTNTTTATKNSTHVLKNSDGIAYDFEYQDSEGVYTFQEVMYEKIVSLTTSSDSGSKNWKSALSEYISQVRDNYDYEDLGTAKECFMFEMDRIYNILKDNYIVQKYTEIFDVEEYGDGTIGLSATDILAYYSGQVRAAYTDYIMSGTEADVLNDVGSAYYIPDGSNSSSYFSVAYIKVEFSDEEAEIVSGLLEDDSDAYTSEAERAELLEQMYANLTVTVRDSKTGEDTDETLTVAQLYKLIKSTLGENSSETSASTSDDTDWKEGTNDDETDYSYMVKVDAFRDFLYLYNDDDTLKNADYNAVFGVDVNGNVLLNDDFSEYDDEYQEAISEAIKTLYNNGNAQIGDITEFVRTDDGVYLFFYAGKIENLFSVDADFDVSKDVSNIEVLANTKLNVFSSKTVFDAIYETLYSDGFSTYESLSVNALLAKVKRVINKNELSDLY